MYTLYMEEVQDFHGCAKHIVFISLEFAHEISMRCAQYFLLSSTQSEVASRDANIRQLEERCEQLEAQVSLAICAFCDTLLLYGLKPGVCNFDVTASCSNVETVS